MATSTSNLGLIKPAGTDHALVANINTNSDTIDTEAGKARANFALVQNGDTATQAISKDQLVVWKGVLKKASANIASGATLSSSNLSDDTIAAELAALNSKIEKVEISNFITAESGYTVSDPKAYKAGNVLTLCFTISGNFFQNSKIATVNSSVRPAIGAVITSAANSDDGKQISGNVWIFAAGVVRYYGETETLNIYVSATFVV